MPWLEICREIVADIYGELERLPTRHERETVLGQGQGGDETTQIDAAAESSPRANPKLSMVSQPV